jgi:hypothetical protein
MPRRIVVSFRGTAPGTAADGARYIAQALAMKKRAEAHGATLCAWAALTFSFCFEADELEETIALAAQVFADAGSGLCAGLSAGELAPIGERGPLSGLAWGMPLVRASSLSRAARPGELLIDDVLFADRGDEILALGFRAEGDPIKRLVPAPTPPAPPSNPVFDDVDPSPSFPAPDTAPAPDTTPAPDTAPAPDTVVETAKRALLQGDVASLERLIQELRESDEHGHLVERLAGFVALRRGATADALRRLRAATEAARGPAQKARARLAYGVALAGAGRTELALLEALEALARAREAHDMHGEHACALFLARLSAASGHADAAGAWARVAARAEAAHA